MVRDGFERMLIIYIAEWAVVRLQTAVVCTQRPQLREIHVDDTLCCRNAHARRPCAGYRGGHMVSQVLAFSRRHESRLTRGGIRCGKNYMASDPIVPPGGQFPIPAASSKPLLALRCAPVIKPYLPEDASTLAGFLVDTPVTFSEIQGAAPIELAEHGAPGGLLVTITVDGHTLAKGPVALNASKVELPFSLGSLKPQSKPFDVKCAATYLAPGAKKAQTFTASTSLSYLPDPPDGRSVTKMDLRTGALLAKPATGKGGAYETVFPVGFYTNFGGYLASNLSLIDEIKAQG